jgi:hypothetical protein
VSHIDVTQRNEGDVVHVPFVYGDKSNPDYQMKFMQLVEFPGLDLHHLQSKG